jgi:hypothetical protein
MNCNEQNVNSLLYISFGAVAPKYLYRYIVSPTIRVYNTSADISVMLVEECSAAEEGWQHWMAGVRPISALHLSPNPSPILLNTKPHTFREHLHGLSPTPHLNVSRVLASGDAFTADVYRTSRQ